MGTLKSTIQINDGFTEPLKNLTQATLDADTAVVALGKSFKETIEEMDLAEEAAKNLDIVLDNWDRKISKVMTKNLKNIETVAKKTLSNIKFDVMALQGTIENKIEASYNALKNEAQLAAERAKLLKRNLPFEIEEAKTAIHNTKSVLEYKLKSYKRIATERLKLFRHNLPFEINEMRTSLYDNKVIMQQKLARFKQEMTLSNIKNKMSSTSGKIKETVKQKIDVARTFTKDGLKKGADQVGKAIRGGVKSGFNWLNTSESGKIIKGISGDFGKMMGASIISNVAFKAARKIKDSLITAGKALVEAINNSLDELELSDKFSAMYGEAGKIAQERSFDLAQEIGESATMVGEMAAKAATQGIGTDDFERVMRLSDKISSLSVGQSTEGVADSLLQNIKSGHDAGGLAQMLGGGEVMERKIKRSGFERALNRGNIEKALEIAEKISEEAGFTDEKYQQASESMSNNFQGIMNNVDNIKKRLSEGFVRQFEPVVKKVNDLISSPQFKYVTEFLINGIKKIGSIISSLAMSLLNSLKVIGVLIGVGVALKIFLAVKHAKQMARNFRIIKGAISWIGNTGFGKFIANQMKSVALTLKEYTLRKAMGKLIKGGLIVGAVVLVFNILKRIFAKGKSTKGFIFGIIQIIMNAITNVGIFFKRIGAIFKMGMLSWKKKIIGLITDSKGLILKTVGFLIDKLVDMVNATPLGELLGMDELGEEWKQKLEAAINVESNQKEMMEIERQIAEISENMPDYIDWNAGFQEALDTNGQSVIAKLEQLAPNVSEIAKKVGGIGSDTDKIRKRNEQEEELSWMKAFSNRQITSAYNSMTSNVNNVTFNRMSDPVYAEMGRRSLSTVPSRAAM